MGGCISHSEAVVPKQNPVSAQSHQNKPENSLPALKKTGKFKNSQYIESMVNMNKSSKTTEKGLLAQKIIAQVEYVKQMRQMLKGKCFTQDQINEFAQAIVDTIIQINNLETSQQKQQISQLFTEQNIAKIHKGIKGKLPYSQLLRQYTQKYSEPKKTEKSRIFHTLVNHTENFSFDTTLKKPLKLSEDQMSQLVYLQNAQEQVEKLGEKFRFSYEQIKQETQNINKMLEDIFSNYKEDLAQMKYTLEVEESEKAAKISRRACEYHQKGIYFFIIYMVRSCHLLEDQGMSVDKIQEKVNIALNRISEIYPPGQGLQNSDKYQKQFKSIQIKQKFESSPYKLASDNKKQQLQDIILKNAQIASQAQTKFEALVINTCLKRSLGSKSGLKINPRNPNPKAMVRIQEKMLFKNKKVSYQPKETIDLTLKSEEENYKNLVQGALKQISQVKFSVSDMVRGKCVYSVLEDILSTIQDIKQFISQKNVENPGSYKLLEVQSRFTRVPPISDITIKILIDQRIVAELQLTLQTNFAAYNFAHKIYEFTRSKLFSKIKVIHNYFEQYQKQMNEMVRAQLQGVDQPAFIALHKEIMKYFGLSSNENTFNLQTSLQKAAKKKNLSLQSISQESVKRFQPLATIIFQRKMKKSVKKLSELTKFWLQKNKHETKIMKSLVIFQFFKQFNIASSINELNEQKFSEFAKNQYQIDLEEYKQQIFASFHVLMKFQEVQGLSEFKIFDNYLVGFQSVYGENSLEVVGILLKQGQINNKEDQLQISKKYYQDALKILSEISKERGLDYQVLEFIVKLEMMQLRLKTNKFSDNMIKELQQIEIALKYKQEYGYGVVAKIFQAQYYLICSHQEQTFEKMYSLAKQMSQIYGVPFNSPYIAGSEYRIGKYFFDTKIKQKQKNALDLHFRRACEQFGEYESWQVIADKMGQYWEQYKRLNLQQPQFKANTSIRKIDLWTVNMTKQKWFFFSKMHWPNLQELSLFNQQKIGVTQCQIIRKLSFPSLTIVDLSCSELDEKSLEHIVRANWKNLQNLNLSTNNINAEGCKELVKANWPLLKRLNLSFNKIKNQGAEIIITGKWPHLEHLNIKSNKIDKKHKDLVKLAFPKAQVLS